MGLTAIIAPPLMTSSFSYFTSGETSGFYFPGMPYLIVIFLTLISFALLLKAFKKQERKNRQPLQVRTG